VKLEISFDETAWKVERKFELWKKLLSASNCSNFEDFNLSFKPTLGTLYFFDFFNQNKNGITPQSYIADELSACDYLLKSIDLKGQRIDISMKGESLEYFDFTV
jgi:hypothetical protein